LKSDICFCVILPNFKLITLAKSNVACSTKAPPQEPWVRTGGAE
jgi:hypothetical protein